MDDIDRLKLENLLLDKRFVCCCAENDVATCGYWHMDYRNEIQNIQTEIDAILINDGLSRAQIEEWNRANNKAKKEYKNA